MFTYTIESCDYLSADDPYLTRLTDELRCQYHDNAGKRFLGPGDGKSRKNGDDEEDDWDEDDWDDDDDGEDYEGYYEDNRW